MSTEFSVNVGYTVDDVLEMAKKFSDILKNKAKEKIKAMDQNPMIKKDQFDLGKMPQKQAEEFFGAIAEIFQMTPEEIKKAKKERKKTLKELPELAKNEFKLTFEII